MTAPELSPEARELLEVIRRHEPTSRRRLAQRVPDPVAALAELWLAQLVRPYRWLGIETWIVTQQGREA